MGKAWQSCLQESQSLRAKLGLGGLEVGRAAGFGLGGNQLAGHLVCRSNTVRHAIQVLGRCSVDVHILYEPCAYAYITYTGIQ